MQTASNGETSTSVIDVAEPTGDAGALTKRNLDIALGQLDDVLRMPIASTRPLKRKATHSRAPPSYSTAKLMRLLKPVEQPTLDLAPPPPISLSSDPRSLAGLLSRLATLRPTTYSDTKPPGLDAATVARYGWQSGGAANTLTCATCKATWQVQTQHSGPRRSIPADDGVIEERRTSLVSHHNAACPWRVRQCPERLYRLPLSSRATILDEVSARLEALRSQALDELTLAPVSDLQPSDLHVLRALLNRKRPKDSLVPSPTDDVLTLALTGWTSGGSHTLPTLVCARCHRTIGLKSFVTVRKPFDALNEHRYFCAFLDNGAWRKQIPHTPGTGDHDDHYAWAWKGDGSARHLASREVRDYVRGVLDAKVPVKTNVKA